MHVQNVEKRLSLLLNDKMYRKLKQISFLTKKSLGALLREAAEKQYFTPSEGDKMDLVKEISQMDFDVDSPSEIKKQIIKGRAQ